MYIYTNKRVLFREAIMLPFATATGAQNFGSHGAGMQGGASFQRQLQSRREVHKFSAEGRKLFGDNKRNSDWKILIQSGEFLSPFDRHRNSALLVATICMSATVVVLLGLERHSASNIPSLGVSSRQAALHSRFGRKGLLLLQRMRLHRPALPPKRLSSSIETQSHRLCLGSIFNRHLATTTTTTTTTGTGTVCRASSEEDRSNNQRQEGGNGVILGIETSCDDTCAAVVTGDRKILAEKRKSQFEIHSSFGGIVPNLAQDAHKKAIEGVIEATLSEMKQNSPGARITGVAVTVGPGLSPCLQVGVREARRVAAKLQVPIIPVHHMEAHALVAQLSETGIEFPFVSLLVSGGHNLLLLAHGVGNYTELGSTVDDSLGEAYDKVARLLSLDLSRGGGPVVEELAREGDPLKFKSHQALICLFICDDVGCLLGYDWPSLKRHLIIATINYQGDCNFSFAGLKTATRLCIEDNLTMKDMTNIIAQVSGEDSEEKAKKADIAASFQEVVLTVNTVREVAIRHLEDRTKRALVWAKEECPEVRHLVLSGGVASNLEVRRRLDQLAQDAGMELQCPPIRLCTDNGAMVAWAGIVNSERGLSFPPPQLDQEILDGTVEEYVDVNPRWPLGVKHWRYDSAKPVKSSKRKKARMSLTEETRLRDSAL
eukprot:jgi/Bigna1/90568/estExt_fgenesh1_pg.C_730073